MSETVKLIIEIPKVEYELIVGEHEVIVGSGVCELKTLPKAVAEGIPLDDVKAEIEAKEMAETNIERQFYNMALGDVIKIIDNIGKAESEDK